MTKRGVPIGDDSLDDRALYLGYLKWRAHQPNTTMCDWCYCHRCYDAKGPHDKWRVTNKEKTKRLKARKRQKNG